MTTESQVATIQRRDVDTARPNRLRVLSSHAWALMQAGESAEEIREAASTSAGLPAEIDTAIAGLEREIAPAIGADHVAALAIELGKFMALAGGGWHPEQIAAWQEQALSELRDYPLGLVLDAVVYCRRRCRWAREFVPMIIDRIEGDVSKLDTELAGLRKLQGILAG